MMYDADPSWDVRAISGWYCAVMVKSTPLIAKPCMADGEMNQERCSVYGIREMPSFGLGLTGVPASIVKHSQRTYQTIQ